MSEIKVFLFASPNDSAEVMKVTKNCTFFCYNIDKSGTLVKRPSPYGSVSRIMYLSDYELGDFSSLDYGKIARDIGFECQSRRMAGVFFDFENNGAGEFLKNLCTALNSYRLTLYLPHKYAMSGENIKIVIPSSISGGSFEQMLSDAIEAYGAQSICLDVVRASQDFIMPSYMPEGRNLTPIQLDSLLTTYRPSVFFSKELCSKYFTYHENGNSHFVIFDDVYSAKAKIDIGRRLGIHCAFVLFSDYGSDVKELIV